MNGEPQVEIHGERIDQTLVQMVESHLLAGAEFSADGELLVTPINANRDALDLFERQRYSVSLALEWLRVHHRLPIRSV